MDIDSNVLQTIEAAEISELVEDEPSVLRDTISDHGASILEKILSQSDSEFKSRYRMNKETFFRLVEKVTFNPF